MSSYTYTNSVSSFNFSSTATESPTDVTGEVTAYSTSISSAASGGSNSTEFASYSSYPTNANFSSASASSYSSYADVSSYSDYSSNSDYSSIPESSGESIPSETASATPALETADDTANQPLSSDTPTPPNNPHHDGFTIVYPTPPPLTSAALPVPAPVPAQSTMYSSPHGFDWPSASLKSSGAFGACTKPTDYAYDDLDAYGDAWAEMSNACKDHEESTAKETGESVKDDKSEAVAPTSTAPYPTTGNAIYGMGNSTATNTTAPAPSSTDDSEGDSPADVPNMNDWSGSTGLNERVVGWRNMAAMTLVVGMVLGWVGMD